MKALAKWMLRWVRSYGRYSWNDINYRPFAYLALLRWAIGLWMIWYSLRFIDEAVHYDPLNVFVAVSLLGMGGALISWELTKIVSQPLQWLIDFIYWPGGRDARPPLDYRLADHYRKTRDFESAVAEYSKIVHFYPQEVAAHARLYLLLRTEMHNGRAADRAHFFAQRALKQSDQIGEYEALTVC